MIQSDLTYSLYRKRPPEARPTPFNADQHARPHSEVDFRLHQDA